MLLETLRHFFADAATPTDLVLAKGCYARAWIDRETGVCMDAFEYGNWTRRLPEGRAFFESERIYWAELLGHRIPDRFGVFRRLFLNAGSTGSDSYRWLVALGFVHLTNLTAFYWGGATAAFATIARGATRWTTLPVSAVATIRWIAFSGLFAFFWALSGLKPSFLRTLFLIAIGFGLRRAHRRAHVFLAIAVFVALDLLFVTGMAETGRLGGLVHYALAILGGRYAFATAKEGHSGFRLHLRLALYSWLACAPLEWGSGRFSPYTPGLSLATLPILGLLAFPTFAIAAVLHAGFGVPGEWIAPGFAVFDFALAEIGSALSLHGGGVRWVGRDTLATALAVSASVLAVRTYRKSRKSSAVKRDAGELTGGWLLNWESQWGSRILSKSRKPERPRSTGKSA